MKDRPSGSPFSKCENGHDLSKERSFIYDNLNRRLCRECVTTSTKGKKKARSKGSFA